MIVILTFVSLLGVVAAVAVPGWSDLLMLAGPCLAAALWLWWRGRRSSSKPAPSRGHVIVDGSNVMHWQDNIPSMGPLGQVVQRLERQGFTVGVMFDANAGYKIDDRYRDDSHMARRLGLPEDRVLVVPKGVSADEYILKAARGLGARVVTNDRYRDWAEAFPEVARPGFLIRGGVQGGVVWLNERDLVADEAGAAGP